MDTEVRRSNLFAGIFRFGQMPGQVKCIMNATWCAPETPYLISRGYFPILFGLSESHHLLPALAHSLSIMLAVAVGRSVGCSPVCSLSCPGEISLWQGRMEGKEQPPRLGHRLSPSSVALPARLPSELHFQLLKLLPT